MATLCAKYPGWFAALSANWWPRSLLLYQEVTWGHNKVYLVFLLKIRGRIRKLDRGKDSNPKGLIWKIVDDINRFYQNNSIRRENSNPFVKSGWTVSRRKWNEFVMICQENSRLFDREKRQFVSNNIVSYYFVVSVQLRKNARLQKHRLNVNWWH